MLTQLSKTAKTMQHRSGKLDGMAGVGLTIVMILACGACTGNKFIVFVAEWRTSPSASEQDYGDEGRKLLSRNHGSTAYRHKHPSSQLEPCL